MKEQHFSAIVALWKGTKSRPRLSQLCLSLVMLVQLAACGPNTFDATETAEAIKSDYGMSDAWYCAGNLEGFGKPSGVTDLKLAPPTVGWAQYYKPGTDPFPCWEYLSIAQRAFVNFDIFPTLNGKAIISAFLKWYPSSDIWTQGIADPKAGVFAVCYFGVFEATAKWESFDTPGELITWWAWPTWPSDANVIEVRNIIQKWVDSGQFYFGFYFTSVHEDLPHGSNSRCLTTLNNLRLEVVYKDKP
jgi:hypothetical protein